MYTLNYKPYKRLEYVLATHVPPDLRSWLVGTF